MIRNENKQQIGNKENVRNDRFNRPFRASEWGCDDFATVDVRDELCYHSRSKKREFRGVIANGQ